MSDCLFLEHFPLCYRFLDDLDPTEGLLVPHLLLDPLLIHLGRLLFYLLSHFICHLDELFLSVLSIVRLFFSETWIPILLLHCSLVVISLYEIITKFHCISLLFNFESVQFMVSSESIDNGWVRGSVQESLSHLVVRVRGRIAKEFHCLIIVRFVLPLLDIETPLYVVLLEQIHEGLIL